MNYNVGSTCCNAAWHVVIVGGKASVSCHDCGRIVDNVCTTCYQPLWVYHLVGDNGIAELHRCGNVKCPTSEV